MHLQLIANWLPKCVCENDTRTWKRGNPLAGHKPTLFTLLSVTYVRGGHGSFRFAQLLSEPIDRQPIAASGCASGRGWFAALWRGRARRWGLRGRRCRRSKLTRWCVRSHRQLLRKCECRTGLKVCRCFCVLFVKIRNNGRCKEKKILARDWSHGWTDWNVREVFTKNEIQNLRFEETNWKFQKAPFPILLAGLQSNMDALVHRLRFFLVHRAQPPIVVLLEKMGFGSYKFNSYFCLNHIFLLCEFIPDAARSRNQVSRCARLRPAMLWRSCR